MADELTVDFSLTDFDNAVINYENAKPDQQQKIDRLNSLAPNEEKIIHYKLETFLVQVRQQNSFRNLEKALGQEDLESYEEILKTHPIESMHFFQNRLKTIRKTKAPPPEKSIQISEQKFIKGEMESLEIVLLEGVHYHLVYLGALKEVFSRESSEAARNADQLTIVLAQGIIGLIHERTRHLDEKHRLAGDSPAWMGEDTMRSARPLDPRLTTRKK